jgi:hypothetical protein
MTVSRRTLLKTASIALTVPFCAKLIGDKAFAALTTPQYLVPFTDAKYGSKVVKVTNPNNPVPGLNLTWGNPAIHHYSIDQAWNADGSLLRLDRGTTPKVFLDGHTYKPLLAWTLPGDVRWHRTNPDLMVFMGTKGIGYWNVRTNTVQVLNALSGYKDPSYQNKGNLSDDGTMAAVTATRSDGKIVSFAYNLVTGQKYPDIDMSGWYEVGWTTISPKGTYIVSYCRKTSGANNQRLVFTLDGKLIQNWTDYERPGHGDFIVDSNGYEVMIGRSKSAPDAGRMIARRLVDGKATVLSSPCNASHTSSRNLRNPGWVFGTFTQDALKSGDLQCANEIAAVSTDGTQKLRRLAVHNSAPNGYYTEPHGSPSPDGKKAIFESNWGNPNGPVASYVAEFPA